jgi:hypothetical protein
MNAARCAWNMKDEKNSKPFGYNDFEIEIIEKDSP